MDTGERDVVCRRDCNRIRDLAGGESEKFPRARGGRDRKLSGVVESLRHHWGCGRKPALDFVRYGESQDELLARCPCLLSRGENCPQVVTRVAESARRHVAVEQIHVSYKSRVKERRLICGRLAAADQRAPARSPVFPELVAQCLEGLSLQRSDGAAEAVQNIAFEKSPGGGHQMLRLSRSGKGADSLDC